MNRSLTEGRRRFFECFGEITSGGRCERFRPLLSAVCDGHGSEAEARTVRAHLAGCNGCRAALRAYRSAPARLAELVPPAVVLPLLGRGGMWTRFSDWLSAAGGERAGAIGAKLQQGAEMVSAQKAAAVVASTAAIAGGGAAVHDHVRALPEREPPAHAGQVAEPAEPQRSPASASPAPGPPAAAPEPRPEPAREEPASGQQVAAEFGPERGDPDPGAAPAPRTEAFAAAAPAAAPAAGPGGGEFGP